MSEHQSPARPHHSESRSHAAAPPEPPRQEQLTPAEKSLMRRLTEVLRFADFMALLMVAATAFSAYAAWRTAQVTSHIFALEERPFVGLEGVTFEQGDTPNPRAVVEYRNFGKIPASGAILTVVALADGKRIADMPNEMTSVSAGVLSPGVPHFFYTYFPVDTYKSVVTGKSETDAPCARRVQRRRRRAVLLHRARGLRLSFGGFQAGRRNRPLPSIGYLLRRISTDSHLLTICAPRGYLAIFRFG